MSAAIYYRKAFSFVLFTVQIFKEIYQLVIHRSVAASDDVVSFVIEITVLVPFLGHSVLTLIANQLLSFHVLVESINRVLEEVKIYQSPTSAALLKRRDDAVLRFYQLLSVFDPAAEMTVEQLNKVQSILVTTVDAMVFYQVPLEREPVLSCLLGKQTPDLARIFSNLLSSAECKLLTESCISNADLPSDCSAENNYQGVSGCSSDVTVGSLSNDGERKKPVKHADIPYDLLPVMVAMMSEPNRLAAWHHLFLRCCKHRQHLVDFILVSQFVVTY
jgi:hypothetical protein